MLAYAIVHWRGQRRGEEDDIKRIFRQGMRDLSSTLNVLLSRHATDVIEAPAFLLSGKLELAVGETVD